ncbi:hypothetical protein [Ruegeria sp. HKCCD8929]|uniref:hypothetical protein n=1 Tax=Ruegeria sp. HKCCD8929 TaxID=2683006 RepID=UPI0014895442|nr:hypothetical protein [Ruegeria sp. HKCCD8929]
MTKNKPEYFAGVKHPTGLGPTAIFKYEKGLLTECYAAKRKPLDDIGAHAKKFSASPTLPISHDLIMQEWENHFAAANFSGRLPVDDLFRLELPPGTVFKRMARPFFRSPDDAPSTYPLSKKDAHDLARAVTELDVLLARLDAICRVVDPQPPNMACTGTEITELVVLAAIATENNLRFVLKGNGLKKDHLTMKDYATLNLPLRLSDYKVRSLRYPWLNEFSPFLNWGKTPTQKLPWFQRYNSAKHNRYKLISQPTLQDCFDATIAFVITLVAQYGFAQLYEHFIPLRTTMGLSAFPKWKRGELYVHLNEEQTHTKWSKVPYPI